MKAIGTVFAFLASTIMLAQSSPLTLVHQSSDPAPANGVSLPNPSILGKIAQGYGKVPLSFEANQGQTDARVKFLSRGAGYTLFLTGDEAVFSLRGSAATASASTMNGQLRPIPAAPASKIALRMKLLHASLAAKVTGTDELPGKSNYFLGNDPKKWRSNVPTYAKVKYEGIYPGVDLVYYGTHRQLEYDFVVGPGADPHRIQSNLRGAKRISRDGHGDLVLGLSEGEVRWQKPVVYQEKEGTRQEIAAHYVVKHKNRVGFEVGAYDSRRPLFIDPLVYSTYLSGSWGAEGYGIAVDSSGNAYVTGDTDSPDFPTTSGAFQTFCSGFPTCTTL